MTLRRIQLLFLALSLFPSSAALAWKPVMHEHLADQVYTELISRAQTVEVQQVEHLSGLPVVGSSRTYAVDPLINRALRAHPAQFRAGVLGPDAYPDMLTGQSILHPDDDATGATGGHGADDWLRRLWRAAYDRAAGGGTDEPLAFMVGYLTHAAGDMYAHTFVNEYAGGPFALGANAVTHVIVEGFVGDRTPPIPAGRYTISIAGVEDFLYDEVIDVTRTPFTPTHDLYMRKTNRGVTLPFIFGEIRSWLEDQNISYRNSGNLLRKLGEAPLHAYRRAWQSDIDRGLRKLPEVSTDVARALFYNPTRTTNVSAAGDVLEDYWWDHMVSMLGAPDFVPEFVGFVDGLLDNVEAVLNIPNPLDAALRYLFGYLVEQATGSSPTEWEAYFSDPTGFMVINPTLTGANKPCAATAAPAVSVPITNPGAALLVAANPARTDCKHEVEAAMQLTLSPATSNPEYDAARFTPAYNTMVMTKLLLLSPDGRRAFMRDLGYPDSLPLQYDLSSPGTAVDNVMVGFMRSLDGSRQWSSDQTQMVAHFDCYLYGKVFADQKGGRAGAEALSYQGGAPAPRTCPDVDLFTFDTHGLDPSEPVCAATLTAQVELDKDSDRHGAVVDITTVGPVTASPIIHVPALGDSWRVTVTPEPVSEPADIYLIGDRIDSQTASWTIRPPRIDVLRAQRRRVGGYVNVTNGDHILGGTDLRTESTLDCGQVPAGTDVTLRACPILGVGGCIGGPQPGLPRTATYRDTLALPHVVVDTTYRVRTAFLDTEATMDVLVLASRVRSITLSESAVLTGVGSQSVDATVALLYPATQGEKVWLRYAPGLSGPPSVMVPAGQDTVTFPVQVQQAILQSNCVSNVGWVEAISELDAASAGLNTGRERYAEIVLQQTDGIQPCMEMLDPDPRLELATRYFDGPPGVPPILYEPAYGLLFED